MKKFLLSIALFAACCSANAQKFSYVPYDENVFMTGTAISDNGLYVAGGDQMGRAFIHNTETKETKYFFSPLLGEDLEEPVDADIRSVNNDGVAVGYVENTATKFDFATGEYSTLIEDEYGLGSFISNDGNFNCGLTYNDSYWQFPYFIVNGEKHALPVPTDKWVGYETMGYRVSDASDDGSIIIGAAIDNFATNPLILWVRNADNETYSAVPVSKRFLDATFWLDSYQPFDIFEGASISADGNWVCLNIHPKDDMEAGLVVARYDVLNDSVSYVTCPDSSMDLWYYANGISNDGTIVGYTEDQLNNGARTAFIVKGGEDVAMSLAEAFPTLPEIAKMDENQFNSPSAITPDGRYIEGFGYIEWGEDDLVYATYYIDTQAEATGVEEVAADKNSKVVASYSVDGKKVNRLTRGITVNKLANGKVVKSLKK